MNTPPPTTVHPTPPRDIRCSQMAIIYYIYVRRGLSIGRFNFPAPV